MVTRLLQRGIIIMIAFIASAGITSCVDEEEFANDTNGNFEALWKIMDEHYCFFDYKQKELGVNWNDVHTRYKRICNGRLGREQLFEVLSNMLGELKDGHVNLSSSFDYGREWSWKENYPTNFSDSLERVYLQTDYRHTCGMQYQTFMDNIGYLRCSSFNNDIGEGNIDEIIAHFYLCNGLIIDVRSNGGGMLTTAEKLASRFTNEEICVGYIRHKTGKGHNDFSDYKAQTIGAKGRLCWYKPVVVLTNRGVFSAANEFVKYMKACGATIVGDRTGGGGGLPFSAELPNGWGVRFSACPMYDKDKNCVEHGIEPDYHISLTDDDFHKGRDSIIEFARYLINTKL